MLFLVNGYPAFGYIRQPIFVNPVEFNAKTQILLNLKLKRKIIKFVKFVIAFNPGHR